MLEHKINWEDHRGLCRLAANIAIRLDSRLAPHRDEIVCDLESKLWEVCEKFDYDPKRSKPSSYLMRALLKHCDRTIRRQYIGRHVSWKALKGVGFYNITDVGYATLHNNDAALERDRREVVEVARNFLDMLGGETAETLERAYMKGERQMDIGKSQMIKTRDDTRRFLTNLQNHSPQKFDDCIATLGRKAV